MRDREEITRMVYLGRLKKWESTKDDRTDVIGVSVWKQCILDTRDAAAKVLDNSS
jgi:hypothetical protein